MKVVLGSIFRDSTGYLLKYAKQVYALDRALRSQGHGLELVFVEGDSKDGTHYALGRLFDTFKLTLIKRAHGGPAWGSVDQPDRWAALSWCANGVMENVPLDAGAFIYVDSDLEWDAATMLKLLNDLSSVPAVAPMCLTTGGTFYATWGFVKDGRNFGPFAPFHPLVADTLTPIDSAGSCVAMRGDVARRARFGPFDFVRGLGRSIREAGYGLFVDPTLKVVQA